MISVDEANVGDCLYAKLSCQSAPVSAEILRILKSEKAFEILTALWGRRIVTEENAYWEEKDAKKSKITKLQNNYKEWAKEYINEETETDHRIDKIHHGISEECETQGKTTGTKSVPKSSKRKQKIVRKSSTKKRKTSRNRKASSSKK